MTAKERILMIRLMEKIKMHPTYAKALVIEASGAAQSQNGDLNHKGLAVL